MSSSKFVRQPGTARQKHIGRRYIQLISRDQCVEIDDDGEGRFDKVVGPLQNIQEGDRVCFHDKKDCSGIVKWIGRRHVHVDPSSTAKISHFIIGVKLDNPGTIEAKYRSFGDLEGVTLVAANSEKDIVFEHFDEWIKVYNKSLPMSVESFSRASSDHSKKGLAPVSPVPYVRQAPDSRFNRVEVDVNRYHVGSRVRLDTGSVGTIKWIGFWSKGRLNSLNDYIVGVELDFLSKESASNLTHGWFEGEQLVSSTKKNIIFTRVKKLSELSIPTKAQSGSSNVGAKKRQESTWTRQETYNGTLIEVCHDGISKFDRIAGNGVSGTKDGDRVYIWGEKSRTGTVRWIGCKHDCADVTPEDNFIVAVEMNSPGKESSPALLTDGSYSGEQLLSSTKRNILFTKLSNLNKLTIEEERYPVADGTPTVNQPETVRTRQTTVNGLPIEVCHEHDSNFDRVVGVGLGSIKDGDRVHHLRDKNRSGTVRWIGCYHGCAIETEENDFSVGVEMDKPELETAGLTDGEWARERLIHSDKKNIKFLSLRYWALEKILSAYPQATVTDKHNGRSNSHADVTSAPVSDDLSITNDFSKNDFSWTREQFDPGFLLRGTAQLQPDKTYYCNILALKSTEKDLAEEVGNPLQEVVNEYVLPPTHPEQYNGFWKGIQGDLNSGYMDASMFAMFSYLTVFDSILFDGRGSTDPHKSENLERTENIREVLRTQIVNPLRKYGLAQKNAMHKLRKLLDEWGVVKGLTGDEKDPEEFLNLLLVHTFSTPPPIVLSNKQQSHLFHLLADKEEGMEFPTVQELVERTCLQENFKFSKIPPYLILHLPRFGRDYKMYEKVMPSMELDITDVLSGCCQSCHVCGEVASCECYGCYKDTHEIAQSSFCSDCLGDYHQNPARREHRPQRLHKVGTDDGMAAAKCVLKLAAVLCIETSHYVTFVASNTSADARWYFFDSMADREGTTNIPQVTEVKEFRNHLREARNSMDNVPSLIRRLVKDGYICFYTNPDVPQYKAINIPLHVTKPGGTTDL